jgi:hypothetical protein
MELHIFDAPTYFVASFGLPRVSVSKTFLRTDPFWLRKAATDPHILADVYRVSQEECARLRESVSYVKLY